MTGPRDLGQTLDRLFDGQVPLALGVAVSGGGDSVALLAMLADWSRTRRNILFAATVDHGLREGSAAEAAYIAQLCAELDIGHTILPWTNRPDSGNLQDAARRARQSLLGAWARNLELPAIALGHTRDDQAETVLMRLARGSGVDGLAAMAETRRDDGFLWIRPLLTRKRAALRRYLKDQGIRWHDDPSNEDDRFDRIKARQALQTLAPLGLTTETLARTAGHMADARHALECATQDLASRAMTLDHGDLLIDRTALAVAPFELQARLMAHALGWVASTDYRPRFRALTAVMQALAEGRTQTLQGCLATANQRYFRVTREFSAVETLRVPASQQVWDTRWRITGPATEATWIAPLGEAGLRLLDHPGPLPRSSRIALPAIWDGDDLIAAPLPDEGSDWCLTLRHGAEDPFTSIISD
ncbi:tRNA lysidine(34) synthetase TilS [Actibacterium sp. 188UL27-1]|uniref:tRNA lysidine(34) synthetase TilS n=1 Tax=Actibacterium sp. 188UL27-1 TaxID=2786961 RepID=UPI00195C9251|nr:tRNA lysidine(34) synthetase TilS [Actibacterium sp. 188UL27-1]MBM7068227.1 tRNA lysidine(34) synthetase TilS [Actibacterium sp. 188UL27-1]